MWKPDTHLLRTYTILGLTKPMQPFIFRFCLIVDTWHLCVCTVLTKLSVNFGKISFSFQMCISISGGERRNKDNPLQSAVTVVCLKPRSQVPGSQVWGVMPSCLSIVSRLQSDESYNFVWLVKCQKLSENKIDSFKFGPKLQGLSHFEGSLLMFMSCGPINTEYPGGIKAVSCKQLPINLETWWKTLLKLEYFRQLSKTSGNM